VGVNVTGVPLVKDALQVEPQLIPAGELETVPEPILFTVNVYLGNKVKVAVTVLSDDIDTMQFPVPVQAPDQPLNTCPLLGVAISDTDEPLLNE
jgi:hypothetical protein